MLLLLLVLVLVAKLFLVDKQAETRVCVCVCVWPRLNEPRGNNMHKFGKEEMNTIQQLCCFN